MAGHRVPPSGHGHTATERVIPWAGHTRTEGTAGGSPGTSTSSSPVPERQRDGGLASHGPRLGPLHGCGGRERAARSPDDPAVCTATRRAHGADFGVHRLPFEAAGERGPPASCLRAEAAPFTPLQRGDAGTSSGPLPEWRRPCHMQPPQASRGCANANHQMTENRKAGPSAAATLHVLRRPRGAVHR